MRKFGGAVIHMRNLDVKYVLGNSKILVDIKAQKPMTIFADETLAFLDAVSKLIRKQKEIYVYSDLAAFAFWCRKSHMQQEGAAYNARVGNGVAFHVVPSNIPLMFMYSLTAALLAGDCVVMRLPAKSSPQEEIIIRCMQEVMEQMPFWKNRIVLVRYGHEKAITDVLSQMCDARVIWGGDASVARIQKSLLREGVTDVAFVDRKSAAVLDAKAVLECENIQGLAHDFYNDTYLNDQNACSSPSVVCWVGDDGKVTEAKCRFWDAIDMLVCERYELPANSAVKKWEKALKTAAQKKDIHIVRHDNRVIRIETPDLWMNWWEDTMHCGYFIEYSGVDVNALKPLFVPKCQTVTCFGVELQVVRDYKSQNGLTGVDRVVTVGHALDFELVWDGIDLIRSMSEKKPCK